MNFIDYVIDFALVLIAAVIIIALFPSILDYAKKPLSSLNYSDIPSFDQSMISSTFTQFANNVDNCAKNGKEKCLCANVIPNWQIVFEKSYQKSIAIEITPSKDLTNFDFKMTFNGRDAGMSRKINGILHVADENGDAKMFKLSYGILNPISRLVVKKSSNLISDKKVIRFEKYPILKIINEDYGNPDSTIKYADVYKFSKSNMYFIEEKINAQPC